MLVAVLRRRWKQTPLLTRCVVGSLYAHLLFATLAYTTNFTSWRPPGFGPGCGSGPVVREVRVKIAHLEPEATTVASVPELLVAPDPPEPEPAKLPEPKLVEKPPVKEEPKIVEVPVPDPKPAAT